MLVKNETELLALASDFAKRLKGNEVIELIGDVGAGKTTFTKGLAEGLGINETIQSPTFTISREYSFGQKQRLVHYDFYRLNQAGIMREELAETVNDPNALVVVEWADVTADVLPKNRVTVRLENVADDENSRIATVSGEVFDDIVT